MKKQAMKEQALKAMLDELFAESREFSCRDVSYQDKEWVTEIEGCSPAGEDVVEAIFFDGTKDGFIKAFRKNAEHFDVDDHAEVYVNMRGKNGVPSSVRELLNDAEAIKRMLLKEADRLEAIDNDASNITDGMYVEVTVRIPINVETCKEEDITKQTLLEGIDVVDDYTCDGCDITTNIYGYSCVETFFLGSGAEIIEKRLVNREGSAI